MVHRLQFYIDGAWVDPAVKEDPPGHQSGNRRGDVRDRHWVEGGRRQGGDRCPPCVRDILADHPRGAHRAADQDHRRLQDPCQGHRYRHLRRDGRADDARGARTGRRRPRPPRLDARVLKNYEFEESIGSAVVVKEPIGVIGIITPWNSPLNQIACRSRPRLPRAAP